MPGQPVILDSFGGIVATTRPEDTPEGASPRNNDVDFIVGRFIQRPGCQSVYTLAQSEYGPKGGAIAVDIDTGGGDFNSAPWSNPSNILLGNASYATTSLEGPAANFAIDGAVGAIMLATGEAGISVLVFVAILAIHLVGTVIHVG